jgi:preprotein translocase subunit SecB
MDESQEPKIRISQIFLERASLTHREDCLSFPPTTSVSGEVEILLEVGLSQDKSRGRIRLRARSHPEAEDLYNFDVLLTALLEREGEGNMPLERYLATNASAMVFPFLREAVANLTGRGRFGPLWIRPTNLIAQIEAQPQDSIPEAKSSGRRSVRAGSKPRRADTKTPGKLASFRKGQDS